MAEAVVPSRAKLGMWLFLVTEIILFGGLFILYLAYDFDYPADFLEASNELDRVHGTVNTLILLASSLLVALAVLAFERNDKDRTRAYLILAITLGCEFLGIKAVEWAEKISHGIYPGSRQLLERPAGIVLYFGLYFVMTGLHALHVIGGIAALLASVFKLDGKFGGLRQPVLENVGMYWHIVDIIWIFLFPLFYLVR